jgi:hypothetical protein
VLSNNVRRTPIRRTAKPTQNALYKSLKQVQADIDLQFQMEQDEVGAESEGHEQEEPVAQQPQQSGSIKRRPGRPPKTIEMNVEARRTQGWPLEQSHPDNRRRHQSIQPSTSAIQSPEANAAHADPVTPDTTAAPKRRVGRPTNAEAAAARAAQASRRSMRVSGNNVEPMIELPAIKKRGMHARARAKNDSNEQHQHIEAGRSAARPVGRPTREEAAAGASSMAIEQQLSNGHAQANRRSARVSGENIEPSTEPAEQAASTSDSHQLRNGAGQAATSNIDNRVRPRVNNHSHEQQQATELMSSAAQPVFIDDEEYDDQAHDTNEEAEEDEEGHRPQGNDEAEENDEPHGNEAEERPDPSNTDPQRLHGHWGQMRGILSEVIRHRDERPNIPDDTFNETLRDCKDVKRTVRAIASDTGPDELEQITSECGDAVSRAEALCRSTSNVSNRDDRGYHIFKFLVPALAKLLKAVIEALERIDIEGAGLPQISMAHLLIVINLIHAIETCGTAAYHAYTKLDGGRPVKGNVHSRITIPLRELHAALTGVYQRRFRTETAREQAEAMIDEDAARKEERQRRKEWREIEMRNQAKWKKMDAVRRDLNFNTVDKDLFIHIRSCPSTLVVETSEDGRPFLDVKWREECTTFTMRELAALEEGLIKHVDRPSPLKSEVFENLMREYCTFGGELSQRNTLEIVRTASDLKFWKIHIHRRNGTDIPQWVKRIPAWMEPLEYDSAV